MTIAAIAHVMHRVGYADAMCGRKLSIPPDAMERFYRTVTASRPDDRETAAITALLAYQNGYASVTAS